MRLRLFIAALPPLVVLCSSLAVAQDAARPPGPPPEFLSRGAVLSLRGAYASIGEAETSGAGGSYLDAARTHYRSALQRFANNDLTGAAAEGRAARELAL